MKNLTATVFSIALSGVALSLPTGAAAQTTELIFNSYLPPMNVTYKVVIADFAKRVEAESKGSVKIMIPGSSLAPSDRQYEMVMDGIADIAIVSTPSVRQMVVLNQIADLPFLAPSSEAASVALWKTYKKYFEKIGELKGTKVLSVHVLAGRDILSTKPDPIDSIDKFKGMKIWATAGVPTMAVRTFGAVPVQSEFSQLFEYMSKGTADAIFISPGSALSGNALGPIKSMTAVPGGLASTSFFVFMNEKKWNSLNQQQKDAVLRAADGLPQRQGAAVDGVERVALSKMGNVKIITASDAMMAEMKKRLAGPMEGWKKSAKSKGIENPDEVIAFYRAALAEVEAAKKK